MESKKTLRTMDPDVVVWRISQVWTQTAAAGSQGGRATCCVLSQPSPEASGQLRKVVHKLLQSSRHGISARRAPSFQSTLCVEREVKAWSGAAWRQATHLPHRQDTADHRTISWDTFPCLALPFVFFCDSGQGEKVPSKLLLLPNLTVFACFLLFSTTGV
jgi:hypothetical protein